MVYGIIAAGEGSRLKADGYHGFKPMVKLLGETLIERLIRLFQSNDATAIYIILNSSEKEVGEFIENQQAALPDGKISSAPIHIIYKDTPSSFHSLFALLESMPAADKQEVCISTIDPVFSGELFQSYIEAFVSAPQLDGLMAVTSFIEDDKPLHVYTDSDGRITQFANQPKAGEPWISGGIYLLRAPALAEAIPAFKAGIHKMRNFQQTLLDRGLYLKAFDLGRIIDIDHLSDIELAEALLSEDLSDQQTF
ncbi:MobA-like NTP transferase domain-containing protein [Arachidicoccus rhizosphaerae]|uniref:MobA-like NTP transferase domain-containing protein n=1 Tax=Arachidicoccus rhizosphaerae TaxID=551991 RepID=A0A1H4BU46_9BACT|nr:NTP transferase domain-containing protein [Arachidicoccus rhizosphaerae]SEA51352.1 MobA-like NTP transferase domain-containing protein [Arachidicoccus rhizosphaerae]